jgi:hypothetical protein
MREIQELQGVQAKKQKCLLGERGTKDSNERSKKRFINNLLAGLYYHSGGDKSRRKVYEESHQNRYARLT